MTVDWGSHRESKSVTIKKSNEQEPWGTLQEQVSGTQWAGDDLRVAVGSKEDGAPPPDPVVHGKRE